MCNSKSRLQCGKSVHLVFQDILSAFHPYCLYKLKSGNPVGGQVSRRVELTESRSQSMKMSWILMKFMEVSPFVQREDLDRLKKVALREEMVIAKASLLMNPCIKTAPVSTF